MTSPEGQTARTEMTTRELLAEYQDGKREFRRISINGQQKPQDLARAVLASAVFIDSIFVHVDLGGADLSHCNFADCSFVSVNFRASDCHDTSFDRGDFSDSHFHNAKAGGATFRRAVFAPASSFEGAYMHKTIWDYATLDGAVFTHTSLQSSSFRGASIARTMFRYAKLQNCNFMACTTDPVTDFLQADVTGMVMERRAVERMRNHGGLTNGDRMGMTIDDPVLRMRQSYSGVMQWVHIAALLLFVGPYVGFMVRSYFQSTPVACEAGEECRSLGSALWQFVYTGGEGGDTIRWLPFGVVIWSIIYNGLRALLLWKTKDLEISEHASGLPQMCDLTPRWDRRWWSHWGTRKQLAEWGFAVNVALVAMHTGHFLLTNYIRVR